jgi:hypothetical protein
MKTINRILLALVCLGASAFGQTALTQTRLSAAVTSASTTTIVVNSATGITATQAAPTLLVVDNEAMFVNAVSGTTLTVQRGASGTAAKQHIVNATVLAGPPSAFVAFIPSGKCANGQGLFLYSPVVSIVGQEVKQWLCSTVSLSVVPGFRNGAPENSSVTTAVASAAGATLPTGPLFHITGTNAITAWGSSTSLGAVGMAGGSSDGQGAPFCVIPDAAYTTTATNNIAKATTGVVNVIQCWTFDATNKKYVPTY